MTIRSGSSSASRSRVELVQRPPGADRLAHRAVDLGGRQARGHDGAGEVGEGGGLGRPVALVRDRDDLVAEPSANSISVELGTSEAIRMRRSYPTAVVDSSNSCFFFFLFFFFFFFCVCIGSVTYVFDFYIL